MSSPQGAVEGEAYAHHAWVDESITFGDVGSYVLAAVITDPTQCTGMREELKSLLVGRRSRLHWRGENADRRTKITSVIAEFDLMCVAVVGQPLDAKRQERARRLCMRQLLHRLGEFDVTQVFVEHRTRSLDQKDLDLINALRSANVIREAVRVELADPVVEPMVWIPDAIAGALSAETRGEEKWISLIRRVIERDDIQLT